MMVGDTSHLEASTAWAFAGEARLDPTAPVSASGSIAIARTPEIVWRLLREVTNWPEIRGDVRDVVVQQEDAFTWSAGPIPVRSRFARAEPARLLTWVTLASGLEAVHVYRFEADGSGTQLSAAESMRGPLAEQAITSIQLQSQITSWLAGIKALAESR